MNKKENNIIIRIEKYSLARIDWVPMLVTMLIPVLESYELNIK